MQVAFIDSIQGHQTERVRSIAERLRKARPDIAVSIVEGDAAKAELQKFKLKFGPAVVIEGRLEYVGIPRLPFLMERIAQVAAGAPNPRSSAPPAKPVESAKPPPKSVTGTEKT